MTKEKQIEELRDLIMIGSRLDINSATAFAETLYQRGWRKQSECENVGTLHPVDEFICSNCGIALEGWERVVKDEDDGDTLYYEYAFKHCPNCGAKMKGGAE